jgi:hypothetical protein
MTIKEKIEETIKLLKDTDINGCITGSSMIDGDFDAWESQPDIDLFVYSRPQMFYAIHLLMMKYNFKPINDGEIWKLDRMNNFETRKKLPVDTHKLERDGIIVNVTYKENKNNIFAVLATFDMSIIMVGYDIRKRVLLDLRCGWNDMVKEDSLNRWSDSPYVAKPNPLRDQDVDKYGVEMWVRQFNRVIKYWGRKYDDEHNYDTRPMARFYIDLINGVLEKGQLFSSEKSEASYNEFKEIYEPLRDKMVKWLEDKEDC